MPMTDAFTPNGYNEGSLRAPDEVKHCARVLFNVRENGNRNGVFQWRVRDVEIAPQMILTCLSAPDGELGLGEEKN